MYMLSSKLLIISIIATALLVSHTIGQELMVEPKRSVEVIEGSENLLHLRPMDYPSFLREQGVQGTVALEVTLDEKGHVMDAQVVSGPTKLRWLALKYVLDWHFAPPTSMPSTVKVVIQWKLPIRADEPKQKGLYRPGPRPRLLALADRRDGILKSIEMIDLRDRLKLELERRLPVRAGQRVEKTDWEKVQQAVVEICEHLELKLITVGSQSGLPELALRIFHPQYAENCLPGPPPPPPPPKK
jgi:TonB family protein